MPEMRRIRIGVVGAGTIAQVEHVPNLIRLKDRFDVKGVCDPSAATRGFVTERYEIPAFDTLDKFLQLPLDAVVIASPDPLHKEHVLAAFERGLHVLCEKPLCYGSADIADLIAARDARGLVLQVGYMKRFDPSYEALLALLPAQSGTLRHVSVEVSDPDAWPFIQHHEWRRSDDVPQSLVDEVEIRRREQVAKAVSIPLDDVAYRGFCGAYCSSIVHDVNAVHGILDCLAVPEGEVAGAQLYARGVGGHGAVSLLGGEALWTMTHLAVPKLADYRERITIYFDDARLELIFPSPYLNHQPTQLSILQGRGHSLECRDIRTSYAEAFVEELKGFASAITDGKAVRNTAEQAARDMDLLAGLARWHASHPPQPIHQGAIL
jgi:predicted dehydrogenase